MTAAAPPSESPTILVVDDDEMMRDLLARMLQRSGFLVITAIDGRDGLERFQESPVPLAITDMKMPGVDGLALIRALIAEQPTVNIIAISGVEECDEHLKAARALGAKAAFRKPVTSAELVDAVRRLMPRRDRAGEERS